MSLDKWISVLLICVGLLGIGDTLFALGTSNMNLGTLLPGAAGALSLVYGILRPRLLPFFSSGMGKALHITAMAGCVFFFSTLALVIVITAISASRKPESNADALIVLGAGLHGDQISLALSYRLNTACEYYEEQKDKKPIIVVTGGQGPDELCSEASAMKKYLVHKGIPESGIIEENQATNTRENFKFSKDLLDAHFKGEPYRIVYVTNDFHVFRAGRLAEDAGFTASGLASPSTIGLLPNFYLREYFSIIKYYVLD